MLYLDYSVSSGEWLPTAMGRARKPSRYRFPQAHERGQRTAVFWHSHHRRRIHSLAQRLNVPFYLGGLGFSLKWKHGWMNDTLKYFSSNPIYRKYEQNKAHFFTHLRFIHRKFHAALSRTDEVVPRKSSLLHKMPATCGSNMQISACYSPISMPNPGKKLLFMGRNSPSAANDRKRQSRLAPLALRVASRRQTTRCGL